MVSNPALDYVPILRDKLEQYSSSEGTKCRSREAKASVLDSPWLARTILYEIASPPKADRNDMDGTEIASSLALLAMT